MKFSIRWVVIIGCIILVWGTHLIITPSTYFSTKNVMLQHTKDIMQNISDLTLQETQNFFSIARGSAHLTKKLIASKVVNTDAGSIGRLEQYFFDQLEIYPQFAGIYLALPNGNFYYVSRNESKSSNGFRTKIIRHTDQGRKINLTWRDENMKTILYETDNYDTYDPRKRPWYIKTVQENQIIWADPYIFFTSQKPGITTSGPVYDSQGNIKGVVGVDIQLDVLSKFISKLRVGKTGLAFMMNKNKDILAFPDPEQLKYANEKKPGQIRLPTINELSNPICGKAYDSIEWGKISESNSQEPIFGTFQYNDEKYYTMFTPVPESKVSWMIGLYIPEKDYFGEINANQKQNLFFSLIISIIATICGLIMASKITKPISELDNEALKIKNNDYNSLSEIKSGFVEIQRTANTFYEMKKAVINYKKELARKELIHKTITDTANDAIIMVSQDGILSYWNTAAEKIFGYTKHEATGNSVSQLIIPEEDRKSADLIITDFCTTGDQVQLKTNIEITTIHKNKKIIPIEYSFARIKIEAAWHAIAIIRDITLRKKAETERINMVKQLQQSQKLKSIGTLAGGIAHDFNNLLFPVLGNTEILMMEMPEDDPLQENLKDIVAATIRASELAKQILTFAHPESNKIQSIKLPPIIDEVLRLMRATLPATIKIEQNIDKHCGKIKADPTHIHQIIMNLSTNAFHSMEDFPEGELKIGLQKLSINETIKIAPDLKHGEYVLLSISDTGVGMDEEVLVKIFDPFFTTKEKDKGTGMGLAVVHGIVTSINGAITVSSEPGKGTEFHVYLPISHAPDMPEKVHTLEQIPRGTERILLVDDEEAIIKMEKQILERLGYTVIEYISSTEALKSFIKAPNKFDIIVTDMAMPNMSGDILASEIRKIRQEIPIILCTGFSNKISKEKAESMGFNAFLLKPIKTEEISKKIRQTLDKK